MARKFNRNLLGGHETEVVLDEKYLTLSSDLDAETSSVASTMGLVGELLANAVEIQGCQEAEYRYWRACKMKEMVDSSVSGGQKRPEYAMSAEIESCSDFLKHKNSLAKADADVQYLRSYLEALKVKSFLVQTKANLARVGFSG